MTERRLPAGFNTAVENDIIQKGANGLWYSRGSAEFIIPGRYLLRTIRTSDGSGTHNLNARTTKFRVFGQGPGGGAGGVQGDSTGAAVGAPGSSGAYFDHIFVVVGGLLTFTYDIGAGGAGGVTGAGQDGSGPTQVTYNGVTVGGGPGQGGAGHSPVTVVPEFVDMVTSTPLDVGSPDFSRSGVFGGLGIILSTTRVFSGDGGPNFFGIGAKGRLTNTGGGAAGLSGTFGGGGSGAIVGSASAAAFDGGFGGDGILIVEEYS